MDPSLNELLAEGQPDDEVAVILRLADPVALPAHVRIVVQFGPIVTCRLRRGDIPLVRGEAPVRSMKAARLYGPTPCSCGQKEEAGEVDTDVSAGDERRPVGDFPTGKGVVIAHIDWGIDFAHPDFRHVDGRTRLLGLWDQSGPHSAQRPNRYGYGRIYDASEIDRALTEADPYAALGYNPAKSDRGGGAHGTHTLGISSGNGRAGGPRGVAPEAKLIFVHLSTYTAEGPTLLGDSVALLEAFDFIARLAGAAPVVINASLGRQAGDHTGTTLTEQGMDAFLLGAPGRAIVQSTGNYYDRSIHAQGMLRPGAQRTLHLITDAADRTPNELDLWYPGVDRLRVRVRGPDGTPEMEVGPGTHAHLTIANTVVGNLYHRLGDPNNGDNQVLLVLYPTAPAGEWEVMLFGDDVADGRFHAWVERDAACKKCQARFADRDSDSTSTTGTICNGLRTLAVGAYDAHADERPLAGFSSSGPTRDGRQKPDVVAPGVRVLAARSGGHDDDLPRSRLARMSGTSMAAPHVTGTIALMFEAAGRPLFIEETRRLLLAGADPVPASATVSERLRLGSGYLNTEAAVNAARLSEVTLAAPVHRSTAKVARIVGEAPPDADQLVALEDDAMAEHDETLEGETIDTSEQVEYADQVEATEPEFANQIEAAEQEQEWESTEPQWTPATEWIYPTESDETADSWPTEDLIEASKDDSSRQRFRRDRRPRPLPFQFQIPIGGGAPGLSVPIGGAGSPLAFSVPLGGTPAPAAPVQAPMPAAAPSPLPSAATPSAVAVAEPLMTVATAVAEPPLTGTAVAEPPLLVAMGDLPPLTFGEQVLLAAEAHAGGYASSASWLEAVLDEAASAESAYTEGDGGMGDRFGLTGLMPSATTLFNTLAQPDRFRSRVALRDLYSPRFAMIAMPGQSGTRVEPQPGDLLVRVALGEKWGHVAVVASPGLYWYERLPDANLRGEGYPSPPAGWYVHVVEPGPLAHTMDHRFARRLSDAGGNVLHDSTLLRPTPSSGVIAESDEAAPFFPSEPVPSAASAATPKLTVGMRSDAVREAQRKLNRVHADSVALGLLGLTGCPLPEDGHFSQRMQLAVTDFQQQVFPDPAKWDGTIGPDTIAHLDRVAGSQPAREPEPPPDTDRRPRGGTSARTRGARRVAVGAEAIEPSTAELTESAGRPTIRRGSQGPSVREAQAKLNIVHTREIAQGLPGLPACPLVDDGNFGEKTQKAVIGFQQRAFPNTPKEWDGIVGPKTWAALDQAAGGHLPLPPIPPAPPAPVPPIPIPPLPLPPVPPTPLPGPTPPSLGPAFPANAVIDERIDPDAQFSLIRMSKGPPDARTDAVGMLSAIKAGELAGIFGDNLKKAAELSARHGTARWLLIPKGEDAAVILEPGDFTASQPPTILFKGGDPPKHHGIRKDPQRMDRALRGAWATFVLIKTGKAGRCELPVEGDFSEAPPLRVLANAQPQVCELPTGPDKPKKPPKVAKCALTPSASGDPTGPEVTQAGTVDFSAVDITTSTGRTLKVRGNAFYPATTDGSNQNFNDSAGTRVPIVFMAHGNHPVLHDPANRAAEFCPNTPGRPAGAVKISNHLGYVYLQERLARLGIASVSVDCNETNCEGNSPQNITERAELIAAAIRHFQSLDSGGHQIFGGHLDFDKVGLLGHSRGGEAVLLVPELTGSRAAAGATFKAVLSLAPTSNGASSGTPRSFAFMTILPAGDGDVRQNFGAVFYDRAVPTPFKSQLYIHEANHNFFNTEWVNPDRLSGAAPMPRADHEAILTVYACAFFRTTLT
ncbi:MAG: S8 family serine peptidase, partial [Vicinamibacterales bacterium]